MPHNDDYDLDDGDDSGFIAAATQVEATQRDSFAASQRPTKRRRLSPRPRQLVEASSDGLEWSDADNEAHNLAKSTLTGFRGAHEANVAEADWEHEEDPEYYFPGEIEGQDEPQQKVSKYRIHVPENGGHFNAQIFTQTQVGLDSSPDRFRGPIWKRPKPPPPPLFDKTAESRHRVLLPTQKNQNSVLGMRQTTLKPINANRRPNAPKGFGSFDSDAALAARLQLEEDSLAGNAGGSILPQVSTSLKPSDELADLPSDAFSSSSPEKSPHKEVIELSSQLAMSQQRTNGLRAPQLGLKQMTIFGQAATQDLSASQAAKKKHAWPMKARDEKPTHHKLDDKAMETWVFPTNLGTIRDYQYNIVSRSLYHNTLVALPTGLGKTFIAATIMLNYYRWTQDAQMVFMAPTKPLIAQQMDACYHIVGIPRHDTVLMTGETTPAVRAEEWLEKRVFFMTPQTVINDLKTGICDPKRIVLVIVDEAHKATGGYAYTEVVKFLRRFNESFRVQALTATPGSSVEAVQGVIDALGIARVELRTEQSLDIRAYTHEKHTDTELFDYSDEQVLIMDLFSKALRPAVEKLCSQNAYWSRDPMNLSAFGLTQARKKWMATEAGQKAPMPVKGMVNTLFTVLASLAHSIGLLKNHGIGPFYSNVAAFQKTVDCGETKGKSATQIAQSDDFTKMTRLICGWTDNPDFIGHPKLEYLREVVLNHFLDTGEGMQGSNVPPSATRVMVFASFRDSTEEICRVLKRNEPMIRPHVFVGQAASKGSEGMDQKRQNAVIQDFKSGKYNTLIATSIGEEGLDIGDVDLIVCYDASSSPIRMLQRIGRTGRKRTGRVVLLLMKGKEENDYAKAQDNYTFIQKSIADASKYTYHDEQSPRILPKGIQPTVDKRIIEIPIENSQPIDLNERGKRAKAKCKAKRPPKKFHMPGGVRTGFTKASRLDSDNNDGDEEVTSKRRTVSKKAVQSKPVGAAPSPKLEPVQLPFLGDILLNDVQQKELERKYAHVANDNDDDVVVRAPDPSRFLSPIRDLGPTRYVRHGKSSRVVERTMQVIHAIDENQIQRMKAMAELTSSAVADDSEHRVVGLTDAGEESDADLPETALAKRTIKAPLQKKPPRSKLSKKQPADRDVAENEIRLTAKKARGRPRKNQILPRLASSGSAAMEGASSSPEPTPANMRIGTQGIDLESRDTSGEEDDEEPDSELEQFVVGSDQSVEMASSSQPLPDDTQLPREGKGRSKKLRNGDIRKENALKDFQSESEKADSDPDTLPSASVEESDIEELPPPLESAENRKRRRVVGSSDSDE